MLSQLLMKRNLTCNESRKQKHTVLREMVTTHINCRYLGSLLDTTEDFKRRNLLAMNSMRTYDSVWKNSNVSTFSIIRIFDSLITPIMLHNSHLWTINETIKGQINAYQRRLLRQLLNIKGPRKISNDQLEYIEWSKTIETARIRWIGHLLRMPAITPARIALDEAQRTVRMPRG